MEARYDIAIVGAGPAGSVLAMLLGRLGRHKVALVDNRRLDLPAPSLGTPEAIGEKSCGGLVAPDAQKTLSRLGLTLPNWVLADPQIFSVHTVDLETGAARHYQRLYVNTHRERFDRWLAAQAVEGHSNIIPCFGQRAKAIEKEDAGWRITLDSDHIHARIVVGADGAKSMTRRLLFPHLKLRRYSSVQHIFPKTAAVERGYFYSFFHRDITDYYAWALPKDDHFLLGAAIPAGKNANEAFRELRRMLARSGFQLGEPLAKEGTLIIRPRGWLDAKGSARPDGSAYLLGEAAGFVSPSSAEGISFAMDSAIALFAALKEGGPPRQTAFAYGKNTLHLRLKLLQKQLKCPFMYQSFLRRMVMASGLQSHTIIE